ncbi:hypothetical protein [Ramlibacter sp.]|uniref:hypothetical protein n=1 Tax=Ramlibacter sp. TaxID=1917967 RepID=UPI003D0E1352
MAEPQYHVILGDRQVGPYDRRTIVGMRIKDTLASFDVLVDDQGARLAVSDLLRMHPSDPAFQAARSGSFSLVQATFSSALLGLRGRGLAIPRFRGEVETRVQTDVLRLAGRFRRVFGWREDRVKIPLRSIRHRRVHGSAVELWLHADGDDAQDCQRLALDFFSPELAADFVKWLPEATPWPEPQSRPVPLQPAAASTRTVWIAIAGTAVTIMVVFTVLLSRRVL